MARFPIAVTPAGRTPQEWAATIDGSPPLRAADLSAALTTRSDAVLLVASAHPDDETLGCGRWCSWWARHAGRVVAVTASAGEACVDHVATRPAGLAQLRLQEWRSALTRLGMTPHSCLGLPDGRLAEHEDDMRRQLLALATALGQSSEVVLASPWVDDPHPDHGAVGRAVRDVGHQLGLAVLAYPVWLTYWRDPASSPSLRGSLRRLLVDAEDDAAHAEAVAEFDSQLTPLVDGLGPVVPPEMLAHQGLQLIIVDSLADRRAGAGSGKVPA